MSSSLEESLACSARAALQAIGAQEAALQAINQHTQKLKEAMEAEVLPWPQRPGACGQCHGRPPKKKKGVHRYLDNGFLIHLGDFLFFFL